MPTAEFLRREASVYQRISGSFVPEFIGWEDEETEPVLLIADLSAHFWPPPWNEDRVQQVLEQIHAMHQTPADLEPFAAVHPEKRDGWKTVAENPEPFLSLGLVDADWLDSALPALIEAESRCRTEGESLCHWDIRSDNLCFTEDRAIFIDWNHACLSNPKLDLGFWLPSLTFESGILPEQILPDAPEVAAWVSGFFAARAGLPVIPHAPRVRLVQQQQLETALPWAIRALELPRCVR